MEKVLLELKGLKTYFSRADGRDIKAADGVFFKIHEQETVCVVGESGCGKSITALSIMGLVKKPKGRIAGGQILFEEMDLTKLSDEEMRKIRGNRISMIFQEPMTSLNPVITIGEQLRESLMVHGKAKEINAMTRVIEMLKTVGIPRADKIIYEYPHQLSGGMRQRVMIAMALICEPSLLIADEPTSALDVTIQAQVLDLIRELKAKIRTAVLFITHDLGVVADMADTVVVMYAGQPVEIASADDLFAMPSHPYTRALMDSIPYIDRDADTLFSIKGTVPDAAFFPDGCRFAERCIDYDENICPCVETVALREVGNGHFVRCMRATGELTTG
jgi:peptide/nickel transport system ATP-binding protein/oligopeptide transport system ATP-binding protein